MDDMVRVLLPDRVPAAWVASEPRETLQRRMTAVAMTLALIQALIDAEHEQSEAAEC